MPTADQRLDQLEPIISELLARQDETAAKVERVSAQLRQLTIVTTNALAKQSDSIEYLLEKTIAIDQRLDKVDQRLDKVDQRLDGVDQRFDKVDQRLEGVSQRLDGVSQQLNQLGQQFTQLTDFLKDKLK